MRNKSNKKPLSPAKRELIALSVRVKMMMTAGTMPRMTCNEAIVSLYRDQGHSELKTMTQWNELGKKIKKGSKALWVWARPRNVTNSEEVAVVSSEGVESAAQIEERYRFFPMCALFSAVDVEDMSEKMQAFVAARLETIRHRYGQGDRSLEID